MRERACNSRAHRRMNRGFFQPLSPQEREGGGIIAAAGEDSDASLDDDVVTPKPGIETPTIAEGVLAMDVSPIKRPTVCSDSAAMEDIPPNMWLDYATQEPHMKSHGMKLMIDTGWGITKKIQSKIE
jgi:hypothetical protein